MRLKNLLTLLSSLILLSCQLTDNSLLLVKSDSSLLTKNDISMLDQEYKFSTEALTKNYLQKKLEKLITDNKSNEIIRDISYLRLKQPDVFINAMIENGQMYNNINNFPEVITKKAVDIPFRDFLNLANPFPSAPVAKPASNITHISFTANWTVVNNSTGYTLYLKNKSNNITTSFNINNKNINSYNITGLTYNTDYSYYVVANNSTGNSNSNEIDVKTVISKIVYNSSRNGNYEIISMDDNGSNQVNLTNNSVDDFDPSFSPDGNKISWTALRSGNYEIYTMNSNGTNQVNVTNSSAGDFYSSWSPDNSKIAFESSRDGNYEIYIMNANGSSVKRLTVNSAEDRFPTWSPDGKKLVFESLRDGNWEIYKMDVTDLNNDNNGDNLIRLTNNTTDDLHPYWISNGNKITFYSGRDGNHEIYIMNFDGTNPVRLTTNSVSDHSPSWSPDGNKIVFSSYRDVSSASEIYVMNRDGSGVSRLTNDTYNDYHASWMQN